MALSYKQIATELAHDLGRLIEAHLANGEAGLRDQVQTASTTALRQFLWDKRIVILGVLKAHANSSGSMHSAIASLRAVVGEGHDLIERLHEVLDNPAALRGPLDELDMLVTDLDSAVELISFPPPLESSGTAGEDDGGPTGVNR